MRRKPRTRKPNRHKTKLGLPDLEHVKSAVLVSLRSPESQRSYRRSIDDFVCWYCSEPRLSFNKTVVTRYRLHLEDKLLAPGTINVRLAAVRRLAYEAADTGTPQSRSSRRHPSREGSKETGHEARKLAELIAQVGTGNQHGLTGPSMILTARRPRATFDYLFPLKVSLTKWGKNETNTARIAAYRFCNQDNSRPDLAYTRILRGNNYHPDWAGYLFFEWSGLPRDGNTHRSEPVHNRFR